MQYRSFKGEKLSALGLGCMRFTTHGGDYTQGDVKIDEAVRLIHAAIERGVNYFDSGFHYHAGESERILGQALAGGLRGRVNVATKAPVYAFRQEADFDRCFEEQFNRLQTDRIDFYLLHAVNERLWNRVVLGYGILEKLERARAQGKIRHIGFSFHDTLPAFRQIVDGYDWDFCQIQLNYVDTEYQAGLDGLRYAAGRGLGVVIMEPLLGGRLANPPGDVAAALPDAPAAAALRYLWDLPEVTLVLSGMHSEEELEKNIAASDAPALTDAQRACYPHARALYQAHHLNPCTGCGYCQPCPHGVNIPEVFRVDNVARTHTYASTAALYARVQGKSKLCEACGACEAACPQHLPIMSMLREVHENFMKA